MPLLILCSTTDCIPIDLMLQEYFPTDTQVWSSLSHRNDRRQRKVIHVTQGYDISNPYEVSNNSHKKIKCSTMCMGRFDNQQISTRHSCGVKGCNTMTVRGRRTQPLLMMSVQIIHKQEKGTHILCLHGSH